MSSPGATIPLMTDLFDSEPRRAGAVRGQPSLPIRGPRFYDPWPPPDRDPADVAVVASRVLATAGRLQTRLRRVARRHGADPLLMRFLLLFAETQGTLRITDVAEHLGVSHPTASRVAERAFTAGLVNKFGSDLDGREVTVRPTVEGRDAVSRCLDAIRRDAGAALHRADAAVLDLLGPPPRHNTAPGVNTGWRAGVRAGTPTEA